MKKLLLAIAPAALLALSGCDGDDTTQTPSQQVLGSGNVVEESRGIGAFDAVSVEGIGHLELTIGDAPALVVRGEDNLLPHIVTSVQEGVLRIRTAPGIDLEPTEDIDYLLTATARDELSLTHTGVGRVELLDLDLTRLDVVGTGVGNWRLTGSATHQAMTLTGVGNYDASDLASAVATVTMTGVGSASVRVTDRLTVTVGSACAVCYHGSPEVESTTTGGGSVGPCP